MWSIFCGLHRVTSAARDKVTKCKTLLHNITVMRNILPESYYCSMKISIHLSIVTSIKNRWSIIFDWSVRKQTIFFSIIEFQSSVFNSSILEWCNYQFFLDFLRFYPNFFWFFLPINMSSGKMQHCKSQKKIFTFVFLFIYCYCYWLYRLIHFLRLIVDWSFNQFFDLFQNFRFF